MSFSWEIVLFPHKNKTPFEGIFTDLQIVLYSCYVGQTLGIHIAGVLDNNILVKARLQQECGDPLIKQMKKVIEL